MEPIAATRYNALCEKREPYLQRAQRASGLTIPSLYPPSGMSHSADLPQTFQSAGADGVSNLAAMIALTVFPPDTPNFQLRVSVDQEIPREAREWIMAMLSALEDFVYRQIDATGIRTVFGDGVEYVLVGGSGLFDFREGPDNLARFWPLNQFAWARDPYRRLVELVTVEQMFVDSLDDPARRDFLRRELAKETSDKRNAPPEVALLTYMRREGGVYKSHQEWALPSTDGQPYAYAAVKKAQSIIPGTEETWAHPDDVPWMPLTFRDVGREQYGRGYVDDLVLGDLESLDGLSEALVEAAIALAQHRWLVNPSGVTRWEDVIFAPNHGAVPGVEGDVHSLRANKGDDLAFAFQFQQQLRQKLERMFLDPLSIQRSGERVTAEEIRLLAQSLQNKLGGAYSRLAERIQRPVLELTWRKLVKQGKIADSLDLTPLVGLFGLTPEAGEIPIERVVVAGVEALGRNAAMQRFQVASGTLVNSGMMEPLVATGTLDLRAAASFVFAQAGLAGASFLKPLEEQQEDQRAAQEAQLLAEAGPQVLQAGVDAGMAAMQAAPAA